MMHQKYSDGELHHFSRDRLIRYARACERDRDLAEDCLEQHLALVQDWRPAKRGKWLLQEGHLICSECHAPASRRTVCAPTEPPFCAECGAYNGEGRGPY